MPDFYLISVLYYYETGVTLNHEMLDTIVVVSVTDGLKEITMSRVADKYSTYIKKIVTQKRNEIVLVEVRTKCGKVSLGIINICCI